VINPHSIDLSNFLTRWYGPPDVESPLPTVAAQWVPKALREWHETTSRWSKSIVTFKRMEDLDKIEVKHGKAIFMSEDGDGVWAVDPLNPDKVYEGTLHGEWHESVETLSEFLIHHTLHEAAFNANFCRLNADINYKQAQAILAPMTEVSFGGWRWPGPGHRIFMSDELVADIGPDFRKRPQAGAEHLQVQIGAVRANDLSYLDEIPNVDWIAYSGS